MTQHWVRVLVLLLKSILDKHDLPYGFSRFSVCDKVSANCVKTSTKVDKVPKTEYKRYQIGILASFCHVRNRDSDNAVRKVTFV